MEGQEAVLVVTEITPGHAGQEFASLLEGALHLEAAGQPAVTLAPGEAIQQPPRQVHEGRNASAAAPAKILAFYVADNGHPLTTAVPD